MKPRMLFLNLYLYLLKLIMDKCIQPENTLGNYIYSYVIYRYLRYRLLYVCFFDESGTFF